MDRIEALRAYRDLARGLSFHEVARARRVKQSTVSKWLANLEDELGVTLIERTTRTRRVTGAGQLLDQRAAEILAIFDETKDDLARSRAQLRGRLKVSLPVVFGERFVLPKLPSFLRSAPELDVELRFSDRAVNLVDEGYDLALRLGHQQDSTLRSITLGGAPRLLVASPGYLQKRGTPRRAAELKAHSCLLHTGVPRWRLGRTTLSPNARVRTDLSSALLGFARAGLGIALLARWLVEQDLQRDRLVEVLPKLDKGRAPITAVFAARRHVPAATRAFIAHLRASLQLEGGDHAR